MQRPQRDMPSAIFDFQTTSGLLGATSVPALRETTLLNHCSSAYTSSRMNDEICRQFTIISNEAKDR